LLILDEVQTGFGRTGKFFCYEYAGVEPDILVMAKGMGSGVPVSSIASRADLMGKWTPGTHGGTYGGGSAIAAAAAKATIDVILEEDLAGNAATMGSYLADCLRQLQAKYPIIGDVRGRGLMVATEFTTAYGEPDATTTTAVQEVCLDQKLLILSCGSYKNVLRWIPPLIVSAAQIDDAMAIFEGALSSVLQRQMA
jgi:4-aminobutyrate aminotransferase-like enzyme